MEDLETPPMDAGPESEAGASPETDGPSPELAGSSEADAPGSPEPEEAAPAVAEQVSMEDLLLGAEPAVPKAPEDAQFKAMLEALVYVAEEPITLDQLATALQQPADRVRVVLDELAAEFDKPEHGVAIREVAGGYKMATKPEHHEAVRAFVRSLKPPLKLSLPALETLAVVAYKQPVTAPEIMEIRGVQGAGVLKTLLDRKLIAAAGRKNVIGKPILYKTTKDFMIQFGLKDLSELPTLKEFEEIWRLSLPDIEAPAVEQPSAEPQPASEAQPVPAAPTTGADEPSPEEER